MAVLFCAYWSLPVGSEPDNKLFEQPGAEQEIAYPEQVTRWYCYNQASVETLFTAPNGYLFNTLMLWMIRNGKCEHASHAMPFTVKPLKIVRHSSNARGAFFIFELAILPMVDGEKTVFAPATAEQVKSWGHEQDDDRKAKPAKGQAI